MSMIAYAAAFWAMALTPRVDVSVDCADGEAITGERKFRVTVVATKTDDIVNQVEFYVGSDLRDSDTSTPYEFKIDSLAEEEGDLELRFKAFTAEGDTGEKTIKVRIDNGMSKGEPFHLEQGSSFFNDGKYREAITSGRIALKINPKSVAARILLARANVALGIYDSAQKFAEDALAENPNSTEASEVLASVSLRRAFNTINRDSDRAATLATIRNSFKAAVEARRRVLDAAVEAFPSVTDANVLAYTDAALRARRPSLVVTELSGRFERENGRTDYGNRLAYAYVQLGRYADAVRVLSTLKRYGKYDAYSYGLLSVAQSQVGDQTASDDALKEALLVDDNDTGVLTAQAYLALKLNRTNALAGFATRLASEKAQRSETWYYMSAVNNRLRRFSEARRAFERAVLADPANVDAYIERALESLNVATSSKLGDAESAYLYDTARAYFETALIARPDSAHALAGISLTALYQKKIADAILYGESAIKAAPTNPIGHFAASAAYASQASILSKAAGGRVSDEVTRYNTLANTALRASGQYDPKFLGGRPVPKEADVLKYMSEAGRFPVLTAPGR